MTFVTVKRQELPPVQRVRLDTIGLRCFCGYAAMAQDRKDREAGMAPEVRHLLCDRHRREWNADFVRPKERAAERAAIESNALDRAREVVESRFELFERDPKVTQCARMPDRRPLRLPVRRVAIDTMMKLGPIQLSAWFWNSTRINHLPRNLRALR